MTIKLICGEIKGGNKVTCYDVTHAAADCPVTFVYGKPVIPTSRGLHECAVVEESDDAVLVRAPDSTAPGGYVHFAFSGEHNPRKTKALPKPPRVSSVQVYYGPVTAGEPLFKVGDLVRSPKCDNGLLDIEGEITELRTTGVTLKAGWYVPYSQLRKVPREWTAFTAAEVEAAKSHGCQRYAEEAERCDAERHRRTLAELGPLIEWHTDGDSEGLDNERCRREVEQERATVSARLRALPRPLPSESPGDYAGRTGMRTPARMRLPYDEWAARVRAEMDAVERGEPVP